MNYDKQQEIWEHRGKKASGFITRRPILSLFLLVVVLGGLGLGVRLVAIPLWFAGQAVTVAKEEFNPRELLRKYEWFKDASAQLDKKVSDIKIYQSKIDRIRTLNNLDRIDRENMMIWEQELAGIKASFNSLAAEYNSQMAKFNWRFCNKGMLPEGAAEPLPREYKSYL